MENRELSYKQIRSEMLVVCNKSRRGSIKVDDEGYYRDVPVAELNATSRNRTAYESNSFINEITDPTTAFGMKLLDGQLYGEFTHPDTLHYDSNDKNYEAKVLQRMTTVDLLHQSHHFNAIKVSDPMSDNRRIVYADLKPCGKYGPQLKENLDNPSMNTAFSLRCVTEVITDYDSNLVNIPNGVSKYRTLKLITFDNVDSGGFRTACKTNSLSLENYTQNYIHNINVDQVNTSLKFENFKMESLTDTEINEILGTNEVYRASKVITYLNDSENRIRDLQKHKSFESMVVSLF